MIYRLFMIVAFSAQATETSLIMRGQYAEANAAFARMELQEYVRPGLTGARVREVLTRQFPADRAYLEKEIPAETGRLRAFERAGADRFQVTMVNGRTFAIAPGPRAQTVRVDGKVVRVRNAPEFIADVRAALGSSFALHGLGLFLPERAEAIAPIAGMIVLAAVIGAYSAWQDHKENRKPTTERYLTHLASTCRDERDEKKVPFDVSRTAAMFRESIEHTVVPASVANMDCASYVKSIVRNVPADQIRAGDPAKTCEQLRAYMDCLEVYKLRPTPGLVDKASTSESSH